MTSLFSSFNWRGSLAWPSIKEQPVLNDLTQKYRTHEISDANEYTSRPSLLYFLVEKKEWEKSPRWYDSSTSAHELYSHPPKAQIATDCFSTEIESAFVDKRDSTRLVRHTKIGTDNNVINIEENGTAIIKNSTHLLVAIALHDYELLFANFGDETYRVSETRVSSFYIQKRDVKSMQLIINRQIDKQHDIWIVVAPCLRASGEKNRDPLPYDFVELPGVEEFKNMLFLSVNESPAKKERLAKFF